MNLAINQPYFFPYIGYFQLIKKVNKFIFLDDVMFIKKGWINRNNFLLSGKKKLITLSLKNSSQNKLINQMELIEDRKNIYKTLKSIEQSYRKAKYFKDIFPLIESTFNSNSLLSITTMSIIKVCNFLELETKFDSTSLSYPDVNKVGVERIMHICMAESCHTYFNLPGGIDLYDSDAFRSNKINLEFIKPRINEYFQFSDIFIPNLSIIDLLMHVDKKIIKDMYL